MAHIATEQLAKIFRVFDADKNGVLSRDEIARIMRKLAPKQWKEDATVDALFAAADVNHDGMVQYEEFAAWLCAEDDDDPAEMLARSRKQIASNLGGRRSYSPKKVKDKTLEERAQNFAGASLEDRDNAEIARIAVTRKGKMLQSASERLRDDQTIVLLAINQNVSAFQWASERLRAEPAVIKAALQKDGSLLVHTPAEVRDDYDMVALAVTQIPTSLFYASERLRNNPELSLLAIKGNHFALRYVGDDLRDDKEFVLTAMSLGASLEVVSDRLKDDIDVAYECCRNQSIFSNFKHFSERLQQVREVLKAAYSKNPRLLKIGPKHLKDDLEIMELVLEKDPDMLGSASIAVQSCTKLVQLAMSKDPKAKCFRYAKGEAQDDPGLVSSAISRDPLLLQYASDHMKDTTQIVLPAVSANGLVLKFASENLRDDHEIVRAAVTNNGTALEFASARLREDGSTVKVAVEANQKALKFASASALDDPELLALLRKQRPWIGAHTPVSFEDKRGTCTPRNPGLRLKLYFPHGVGDGAEARMTTERSESYIGRSEMRSSSHRQFLCGVMTGISPTCSVISVQWQQIVSRTTRDDYDRDGHDESDTGWVACAPRAGIGLSNIDVSDMVVEQPGSAFEVPHQAQEVLDTMLADMLKIVFQVQAAASADGQIALELSTLGGEKFQLSVGQDISVQEVMAKLRSSRSLPVNAHVMLIAPGGRAMNYWDALGTIVH